MTIFLTTPEPLQYGSKKLDMKTSMYIKLQKKVGGKWVSTNQSGEKIYAAAENVDKVFDQLKKKKIPPQKTVIGYIEKYGQVNIYCSLSVQKMGYL